jgi:hypothetical protein
VARTLAQVGVPVAWLCDAGAAIRAAYLDPAAGREAQVATDEDGELDVRLEHQLRRLGRIAATYRDRVIAAPPDVDYP